MLGPASISFQELSKGPAKAVLHYVLDKTDDVEIEPAWYCGLKLFSEIRDGGAVACSSPAFGPTTNLMAEHRKNNLSSFELL